MIRRIVERVGAGWIFLIAVLLLYVGIGVFSFPLAGAALRAFLRLLVRVLPVLVIVFALLFLSNVLIDARFVVRYLGRGARRGGWPIAVAAGIISAGPIYLWYPLLSDLKEKGMRDALIAAFLYNRAVKIPLLPMMIVYFGAKVVVVLTLYMIVLSVVNGFAVEWIVSYSSRRRSRQ